MESVVKVVKHKRLQEEGEEKGRGSVASAKKDK